MALPLLTQLRQTLWTAVKNFDDTKHPNFRAYFDGENDTEMNLFEGNQLYPALGQLPAIAILPANLSSPLHKTGPICRISYGLSLTIWTRTLIECEKRWQDVGRALWQYTASGSTATVVDAITALNHQLLAGGPVQAGAPDGSRMWQAQWIVVMTKDWNPRTDAGSSLTGED